MKEYICLTNQGFTESPTNQEIENQQVLGYVGGSAEEEALDILLSENPEILSAGFKKSEIILKEVRLF